VTLRVLVLIVLTLVHVAGCATVRPWQRERLAHPCMQLDDDPAGAGYDAHVRAVRVPDIRAGAARGGGCGCN